MNRVLVLFGAMALLLAGCSGSPTSAVTGFDPSASPSATMQAIYGARLVSAEPSDRGEIAVLVVRLASGEPTGTEPFAALASLVRLYPSKSEYQVSYYLPPRRYPNADRDLTAYVWRPAHSDLEWTQGEFSGSVGTSTLSGRASSIDTSTLLSVAAGKRQVPAFGR